MVRFDSESSSETFSPHILLACDLPALCASMCALIEDAGFRVRTADDYSAVEALLLQYRHEVVLLDISAPEAVEAAVETAIRLKRQNAGQFVGYLADPILDSSGLAGDAVFPRSPGKLPGALRRFFRGGSRS